MGTTNFGLNQSDYWLEKYKALAAVNTSRSKLALVKGKTGRAAYHKRRAEHYSGLAVVEIIARETA